MSKSKSIFMLILFLVPFIDLEAAEYRLGLSMHDVERRIDRLESID